MTLLIKKSLLRLCAFSDKKREKRFSLSASRPLTIGLVFTFNLSLLTIQSCGLDVEDSTLPSKPQWVPKSLPEEWPERGIDAHESGGIFLEWEPKPFDENVTSYLLYRAESFWLEDSLGDFALLETLMLESYSDSEYIDRSTTVNTRYHYLLFAEDASGNISTPSDTLSYTRLSPINSSLMLPNGLLAPLDSDRELQWTYGYSVAMETYTMTILNADNELILRRELIPGNYIGGGEYYTVPDTIVLRSGNIYKWRVDMSGRYAEDCETAGSESPWATFLYSGP
jgi:hypothetical protein